MVNLALSSFGGTWLYFREKSEEAKTSPLSVTADGKERRIGHQKRAWGYLKDITEGRKTEQNIIVFFFFFFLMTFANTSSSLHGKIETANFILLLRKRKHKEGMELTSSRWCGCCFFGGQGGLGLGSSAPIPAPFSTNPTSPTALTVMLVTQNSS